MAEELGYTKSESKRRAVQMAKRPGRPTKYDWSSMEVGDEKVFSISEARCVRSSCAQYMRLNGKRAVTKRDGDVLIVRRTQ